MVAGQVKKYFWDIDPEDADHPTIHGLRWTGILARAEAGYHIDQIANDIGMTRRNVEHDMRFRDPNEGGLRRQETAPARPQGLDREPRCSYIDLVRGADLQD